MNNSDQAITGTTDTSGSAAQDSPGVLVFPPFLYAATLALGLMLHYLWPESLRLMPWERIAAAVLVISGGALAFWGRSRMVRAGTNVFPTKPSLSIVSDGPFRFTRNPLYLGNLMCYLGLALIFNSLWLLLLAGPLVVVLRWGIIAREERYLEAKFGKVYLTYKARVRRWL